MTLQTVNFEMNIPDGYEVIGYRPPAVGDWYLSLDGEALKATIHYESRKIILREVTEKRITVSCLVNDHGYISDIVKDRYEAFERVDELKNVCDDAFDIIEATLLIPNDVKGY